MLHNFRELLSVKSRLVMDRRAVTALEYGLIGAVVAAVMVVGATSLGSSLSTTFGSVSGSI